MDLRTQNQALLARTMTEEQLLINVLAYAKVRAWRAAHFRPAKTAKGWRTAVQGDGKGYPDLLLLRGTRGVVIELKSMAGKVRTEQEEWLNAFAYVGFETYILRPSDWLSEQIQDLLR